MGPSDTPDVPLEPLPRRPVLLLVDVEPDARKTRGELGGWEGTTRALAHLEGLRGRLEERTGARVEFNWFLRVDPQIASTWGHADWVARACPAILETIEERGDYCGIHVHLWRWSAQRREWFNELNDPDWTAECLSTSIDAFRRAFGRPPEACRFGDRWLDQRAVDLMQGSGIRYDLTLEPGLPAAPVFDDPHATGRLPDYRGAPREPYQPSPENFLVPRRDGDGRGSLWMVPVTTTRPRWRLTRRAPYLVRASRSPNLALGSSYVVPHLRAQLDLRTTSPLVVVFRAGDLGTPQFLANFLATVRQLLDCRALARSEFTNPVTAVARWRAP